MHWDQGRRRRRGRRLGNNHKLNSLVFTSGERNQQSNTTHTQIRASWLFVWKEVGKKKAPHSLMELITVYTT